MFEQPLRSSGNEESPASEIEAETGTYLMNKTTFQRLVKRAFHSVRCWLTLMLIAWVASRISRELAMAIYTEALKAGWYDAAR
ncbi:hypothetical protein Pden_1220 [Paracoccus denitrificans PD1222]|jgi:hypothetical protein|uniref:Uncharacterized protein n=2 Tax=Paracoccus denitrificans TaxID=266 RepID=A1B1D1_PARDP|nr:hypothetical protein Pden_1220 [Paracoccus denitrificans PD1222]